MKRYLEKSLGYNELMIQQGEVRKHFALLLS